MDYPQVRNIVCVNDAGFVMSFGIELYDPYLKRDEVLPDVDTGNFPITQSRTIDLTSPNVGLPEGARVRPQVRPVWGSVQEGDGWVLYDPNSGETATYQVSGVLGDYTVHLLGS